MPKRKVSRTYSGAVKLRDRKLSNGDRSLYLDIYHRGERKYEFLELYLTGNSSADAHTMLLAETTRAQRELELKSVELGLTAPHMKKLNVVEFMEELAETRGHKSWHATILHLKAYLRGSVTFEMLTPAKLDGFRTYLLQNVSTGTAWLYWGKVSATFNEAVRQGIITKNPVKEVKGIAREKSRPKYLTKEDVQALKKTESPHEEVKRAFLFACFTGMARCDIRSLRWHQLRDNILQYKRRKTSTEVMLPLHVEAAMVIGDPGEDDELVFGNLPCDRYIGMALTKWAQTAGVRKNVTFHCARHTFGTMCVTAGVDIYVIRKLMGHTKVTMTQVYADVVDEKIKEAIDALPTI